MGYSRERAGDNWPMGRWVGWILALCALPAGLGACEGVHALRAHAGPPEWSDSPALAAREVVCKLEAASNGPATLLLRQYGVKRGDWKIVLNGKEIGTLVADEHRQMLALEAPAGVLRAGVNELRIAVGEGDRVDDILVDRIELVAADFLGAGSVRVRVVDGTGKALPSRITVTSEDGTLQPVGAESRSGLAVRTGVLYTADGAADFTLAEGEYVVWANRGFEYGAARETLTVAKGASRELTLRIEREVEIPGWTAGDTHLHTLELSGHGDASVDERAATIAGEGLDWAVVTEHNQLRAYPDLGGLYTVVPGVEFTTSHGHFNVFPWPEGKALPDPKLPWAEAWRQVPHSGGVVAVWNHPRDDHSGYTPFAPSHYVELVAESLDDRVFPGGGMEVVNSGAMYSHPLRLVEDWMRHLNRGLKINAVGSSDSHTVSMSQAGQARTYAKTGAGRPTPAAVAAAFERGETALSYGLAAFLEEKGGRLTASVYGPSWSPAERLIVYANGERIAEREIEAAGKGGLQWRGEVAAPGVKRDAWLAVVAVGGSPEVPFWEIQRPYQAVTSDWSPMTLGVSPALAWDGDRDGRFETARAQAEGLVRLGMPELAAALRERDAAVAAHVGFMLAREGRLEDLLAERLPAETEAVLERAGRQYRAAVRRP